VERVWENPTLVRRVQGPVARVPFEVYKAFTDSPDVVAGAAKHLRLARWDVEVLSADEYRGTDHEGAKGAYRVLDREVRRGVILSAGEHTGRLLGTIRGSALTILDYTPVPQGVEQSLTAYILIENRLAAALAKILLPMFGWLADRKLAQGLETTARVAEWAVDRREEFCGWLARSAVPPARRQRIEAALPPCPAQDGPSAQR
jgi:hypothetical protein